MDAKHIFKRLQDLERGLISSFTAACLFILCSNRSARKVITTPYMLAHCETDGQVVAQSFMIESFVGVYGRPEPFETSEREKGFMRKSY